MKLILEQLAQHPGVRLVALVMEDGVPVHVQGSREGSEGEATGLPGESANSQDSDALAGLSAAWVHEVIGAIAPLSWDAPARMALRCAQGTLVLRRAHNAWLLVLLTRGLRTEDVLLAMDGAAARVERLVRGMGSEHRVATEDPPPALPGAAAAKEPQGEEQASPSNADMQSPQGR